MTTTNPTTSPSAGGNAVSTGGNATPPAAPPVTLTIDGVQVSVPKNTLVIRAAEQIGVQIPRFCDHPLLEPVGACRQCLVDVAMPGPDGSLRPMPKPQASCTMTVSEGMEVKTQLTSPVADKAQQGIMEFLLINHPLDCPVCDKGGECPLQNQAMSNGRAVSRFADIKRTYPKPINISSQVLLDRERCVLCARCTRFSDQIAGDPFIALVERGALQQVGIYEEKPFESYFSGNTVQICPVGALTGAAYRFRVPAVRPGLHAERVRALRLRLPSSAPTTAAASSCAAWRGTTRRSTRSGTATRAAGPSSTPRPATASPRRWCATSTASCRSPPGPRRWPLPRRACGPPAVSACSSAAGCPPRTPTPTASSRARCSTPTTSTSAPGRTPPRRPTSWRRPWWPRAPRAER